VAVGDTASEPLAATGTPSNVTVVAFAVVQLSVELCPV
jgi:hypothetical protein